jgi:hypothetical protein
VWRTLTLAADEICANGSAIDAATARTTKYISALFILFSPVNKNVTRRKNVCRAMHPQVGPPIVIQP